MTLILLRFILTVGKMPEMDKISFTFTFPLLGGLVTVK